MKEPRILYKDNKLLAVDKPSGMVVNRAISVKGQTVQDWAERKLKVKSPASPAGGEKLKVNDQSDFLNRCGIVHRLDKETSGVLLIAQNPSVLENLQAQFKNREVEKKYTALVHGKVFPEKGAIEKPVGRLPWNRKRFGVLPGGRSAETTYKVVKVYSNPVNGESLSLLELKPKTGRTHQLRVHLKSIGHSIVADSIYAGRKTARRDRVWCPRLFLHASKISFQHPKSGKSISVEAPLPQDLKMVLQSLNNK